MTIDNEKRYAKALQSTAEGLKRRKVLAFIEDYTEPYISLDSGVPRVMYSIKLFASSKFYPIKGTFVELKPKNMLKRNWPYAVGALIFIIGAGVAFTGHKCGNEFSFWTGTLTMSVGLAFAPSIIAMNKGD